MSASFQPRRADPAAPPNARLDIEPEDAPDIEIELRGYTRSVVGALEEPGRSRGSRRLRIAAVDVAVDLARRVEANWRRDPQAAALAAVRLAELHDGRMAQEQAEVALRVFDSIIGGRVLPVGIGARGLAELRGRVRGHGHIAQEASDGSTLLT